jgi:hypothetical protein
VLKAGNTEWIYASANSIVALLLIVMLRTMELCTTDEINQSKVSGGCRLHSPPSPSAVAIRMSRDKELSQATKGDDSVTWSGRVK